MKHVATMYGVCLDEVKKFVGMDVHKNQITVAVADADSMEVRSHGTARLSKRRFFFLGKRTQWEVGFLRS